MGINYKCNNLDWENIIINSIYINVLSLTNYINHMGCFLIVHLQLVEKSIIFKNRRLLFEFTFYCTTTYTLRAKLYTQEISWSRIFKRTKWLCTYSIKMGKISTWTWSTKATNNRLPANFKHVKCASFISFTIINNISRLERITIQTLKSSAMVWRGDKKICYWSRMLISKSN